MKDDESERLREPKAFYVHIIKHLAMRVTPEPSPESVLATDMLSRHSHLQWRALTATMIRPGPWLSQDSGAAAHARPVLSSLPQVFPFVRPANSTHLGPADLQVRLRLEWLTPRTRPANRRFFFTSAILIRPVMATVIWFWHVQQSL